jgi:hypothetical protein
LGCGLGSYQEGLGFRMSFRGREDMMYYRTEVRVRKGEGSLVFPDEKFNT